MSDELQFPEGFPWDERHDFEVIYRNKGMIRAEDERDRECLRLLDVVVDPGKPGTTRLLAWAWLKGWARRTGGMQ